MQGRVKGSTVGCRGSDWPLFLWGPLRALQNKRGFGTAQVAGASRRHALEALGRALDARSCSMMGFRGFGSRVCSVC